MAGGDMNTMKKCSTCGTLYAADLCPKCMAGFAQQPSDPAAPPEELPLQPGQTFHGLEILELLGKGGMGVVYKARQPALDRLVALKILPRKMALDPDFQGRFIREAKALGALSHPNIVAVHDFGAEGGLFFFAMEFVDGTNLRQILRDRKLTPEQALRIVPQLCDALEFAHGEGVVHRDIKPENILLDRKGRVKIADFGLAKLTGSDRQGMLTVTNMVMGTPHYMAPEQVENPKSVDHRADIYAIGVVLYEMLTGELPIGRFESPSKKVQVDVRLDEVVLKALEKSPEARYQKASDVKDAVTRATAVESYSPTVITPVPGRKPRNPATTAIAAAALAALALLAFFAARSPAPSVPTPPVVTAPPALAPVDLTRLHVGPEDRPQNYVFAQPDPKGIPRIPFPAQTPAELETLVKFLDDIGLQNVSPSDLKQAYLALWFRGTAALLGLESPHADRLEKGFLALSHLNWKWAHRQGAFLVLAWVPRRDSRALFVDLVALAQKKLGLPPATPDIPLDYLRLAKDDLATGWQLLGTREGADAARGVEKSVVQDFAREGAAASVRVVVERLADAKAPPAPEIPGARRVEERTAGRVRVRMALLDGDVHGFERLASGLRDVLGFPSRDFSTMKPAPGELPDGYTIASEIVHVKPVLDRIAVPNLKEADVAEAWFAELKPRGSIVLLRIEDSQVRNAVEAEFRKRGGTGDAYGAVFGVEGPDDATLDDLENRMREKFGWDPNSPRPLKLPHVRLLEADLPPGATFGAQSMEARKYETEVKSGPVSVNVVAQVARDYGALAQIHKMFEAAEKLSPADLVLVKNLVIVRVSGPPAAWPLIDALEPVLRRKMRLGPAKAEDYAVDAKELPPGSVFVERRDLGLVPNPQLIKDPGRLRQRGRDGAMAEWAAVVDPQGITLSVLEYADEAAAAARAKDPGTGRARWARARGPVLVLVEGPSADDSVFKALAELFQMRLRVK
jgi:serine/threonine protein kinase